MKKRHIVTVLLALTSAAAFSAGACAESGSAANITIDTGKDRKPISPYIYGINSELVSDDIKPGAIRAGGNRFTAYNWVNNFSNAGSDWNQISDDYFLQGIDADLKTASGAPALQLSRNCEKAGGAYSIMTLQMAGYVAADGNGEVAESETAPSARWNKVELTKGSDFTTSPDTSSGTVYMDEFVNYLVKTLGNSSTAAGIKAYSLDNEPSLWNGTHPRVHPEQTTCKEIIEKSTEMSKAIKQLDSGAEVFGPALYGFNAYTSFQNAPDWNEIKAENADYRWFVDYYLDSMKKASDEAGERLLDVLDVHYYTEAKGECGERSCDHYSRKGCVEARMNSTRTLWDSDYREDSWIADTGTDLIPILPNLQKSIDEFYPGTKLAITEYDFGGSNDICGAIAEADALGIYAKYGVYCANLFSNNAPYQLAAIDMFTNYDKQGNGFGDTLVSCESDNADAVGYASIDGENEDVVKLVLMNKSFDEARTAKISLENGNDYKYVHTYGMVKEFSQVFDFSDNNENVKIGEDEVTFEMQPQTLTMLVIAKDKEAFDKNAAGLAESADAAATKPDKKQASGKLAAIIGGAVILLAGTASGIICIICKSKKKNS